ncbi:hypothetical protein F5Y17DRAFT_471984 [Xylariaceae sp. FL0594]|nr:hypothetical protein F5Y17DRAFT_471984 [Xylariaceae sp. FL0594]
MAGKRRRSISDLDAATVPQTPTPKRRKAAGYHDGHTKERYRVDLMISEVQDATRRELVPTLSTNDRRLLAKRAQRLIRRRNHLDHELIDVAYNTDPTDRQSSAQRKLLRRCARLREKERVYLESCGRLQSKLKEFYRRDPSLERASDYDLVRKLLWRFKRKLGPRLDEITDRRFTMKGEDTNSSSSRTPSEGSDTSGSEDRMARETSLSSTLEQNTAGESVVPPRKQTTPTPYGTPVAPLPAETQLDLNGDDSPKEVRFALSEDRRLSPMAGEGKKDEKRPREDTDDLVSDSRKATASDTNANLLTAGGIRLSRDSHGTPAKGRLDDSQRRLEKIVNEGFDAIDKLIRDDPNPTCGLRRKRDVYSGNPYLMSGALVAGGTEALNTVPATGKVAKPDDVLAGHSLPRPKHPEPVFAPFLEGMTGVAESVVYAVNNDRTAPKQADPCKHSRVIQSEGSTQNVDGEPAQSGCSQTLGETTRRNTPIPAPEP